MLDGLGQEAVTIVSSSARTLVNESEVLACFGIWPLWPGVGRAWAMLSETILLRYPLTLHREVSQCLGYIEERDDYHRIEAVVRVGHAAGHRWIRRLGFRREGLMQNYGYGGTIGYHLYARIR